MINLFIVVNLFNHNSLIAERKGVNHDQHKEFCQLQPS